MNNLKILLFIIIGLFFSCTENDEETIEIIVSVADFETSIDENSESGQSLGTVEATTNEGSITYSISEQVPNDAIAINSSTGEITILAKSLFDFEVNPVITALFKVENGDVFEAANITIILNDINETTVSVADFETSVDENPEFQQSLGTVEAITNEGSLEYSITEQSPNEAIAINSSTGEITVLIESLFDFEVNPTITALVKVKNGKISDTANITININVPQEIPELVVSDFIITMDEHPNRYQSLGFVEVQTNQTDLIFSYSSSIGCSISSDGFTINRETGELIVLNPRDFDYETNPQIFCFVTVTSNEIDYVADILITIRDIPDPIITVSDFITTIDENPEKGTSLGFINASTTHGTIDYRINDQSVTNALTVDAITGELRVDNINAFNFEVSNSVESTIGIHNNGVFVSVNVTINLIDKNEQDLQIRLDNGETPCEIYQSDNSLLQDLYGLNYQGGLIFYLNTIDCTGMIAAPNDQGDGAEWGCYQTYISNATNSNIGSGLLNTNAIISSCNESGIASSICADLILNGHDDWYLPSKDELNLLYTNLHLKGFGNFANGQANCCYGWYWSSTDGETNGEAAWVQSFRNDQDGFQTTYDIGVKEYKNHVRAVRSF